MTTQSNIPTHVAIIMDGNGRWANQRNLPRMSGHEEGVKTIERVIKKCIELNIKILTLFAFGIENWGRPPEEVNFLMDLFVKNLETQAEHFFKNNIQLRVIGDSSRIHQDLQNKIEEIQLKTSVNTGLIVVIAFNYSGRWDLLQATKKVAALTQQQQLNLQDLDYSHLEAQLSLYPLPDPDLLIRTSGELRISNFLLWQLAYTELYFTPTLWPDFAAMDLENAVQDYALRQRRYGLVSKQNHQNV